MIHGYPNTVSFAICARPVKEALQPVTLFFDHVMRDGVERSEGAQHVLPEYERSLLLSLYHCKLML